MYIFILSFTTSHVTVYQNAYKNTNHRIYFNTSHVTVYRRKRNPFWTICPISIHLMLLFIDDRTGQRWWSSGISIHLMLLFIGLHRVSLYNIEQFHYISCYCLSKGYEIVNTLFTEFQYISCYCLSAIQMRRGLLADLFQYISCYCLSPR